MQRLNLTLPTPAENVALDEALLDWAEEADAVREVLRIWESAQPMVVAGRSSRIAKEVNTEECARRRIPIVRRSSGGAAIVAGPGCLMYALVLSYQARPELRDISRAHKFVLSQLANALRPMLEHVGVLARGGTSDLVISDCKGVVAGGPVAAATGPPAPRKFSGNSLRAKRSHCLYHGTLLYDFDLTLIATCLQMPPRQPDYRGARQHLDFVMNVPLSRQQLIEALDVAWPTSSQLTGFPLSRVENLVANRFGRDSWNLDFA